MIWAGVHRSKWLSAPADRCFHTFDSSLSSSHQRRLVPSQFDYGTFLNFIRILPNELQSFGFVSSFFVFQNCQASRLTTPTHNLHTKWVSAPADRCFLIFCVLLSNVIPSPHLTNVIPYLIGNPYNLLHTQ